MQRIVNREASAFGQCLRSREANQQTGHIALTFYQVKKARWPFPSESIPWEVWNLRVEVVTLSSEIGTSNSMIYYNFIANPLCDL